MVCRLQSPEVSVTQTSCLQFYYFGQSSETGDVKTIAVMTSSKDGHHTIWRVHGITNNAWQYGQVNVHNGTFHLEFLIIGQGYRGGFDDILLTPGECKPFSNYFD